MELLPTLGLIALRIITIYPFLLAITLFMGRKSIGEMPVFDFLIVLTLGSVVGADISETDVKHLPIMFAVLMIGLLQKLFAHGTIRFRRFGKLITFEPLVVVHQGKIVHTNLKKAQYSVDSLLQMLRENQVFDLSTVELAVLEGSGKLSVMEQPAQPLSYPLIKEGELNTPLLNRLGLQEQWVQEQLQQRKLQMSDIFLATIDEQQTLHITLMHEPDIEQLPPIFH